MGNPESKLDSHQIDSQYAGFPSFTDWVTCTVNLERWERACSRLRQHRQSSPEAFKKALNIVSRATAVDTGAIENLYETDRGFTFTVAMELASWEAAVEERGANVRPLLEAQFNAYDYVLDLATSKTPLSEAWIRELHEVMCAGQETYLVSTPQGPQKHPLPRGKYKVNPNHVRQQDGQIHAYAPVDLTADEMHRFILETRSETFQNAHPALQAAYAHYAFVAIHPFADGNGRVARALASVFTLRVESIPVLVLFDTRAEYYEALQAADQKDYQPFVDFMFNRSLEGIELASESFETMRDGDFKESVEKVNSYYSTKSGYGRTEIEKAGLNLIKYFRDQLNKKIDQMKLKNIVHTVQNVNVDRKEPGLIILSGEKSGLNITSGSLSPFEVSISNFFVLIFPIDPDLEDEAYIENIYDKSERYGFRIDEILPSIKSVTQIRISLMADRLLSRITQKLEKRIREQSQQS
jgi:Fic family protein